MSDSMTAYPDLGSRDEYLQDRLHRAAEIVWLWKCGETGREDDETWPDGWVEQTMDHLRAALFGHYFYDADDVPFWVYWRALEILNLPRSYASSSRAAEPEYYGEAADPIGGMFIPEPVVEPVVDFDPAPVATNPIRDWVTGAR